MSGALLIAAAIMATIFAAPAIAFAFYYRNKKNAGREYSDRIVWPLWLGFSVYPFLFLMFVGYMGVSSAPSGRVSNEFEMIEVNDGPSQGIEVSRIDPSGYAAITDRMIQAVKTSRPFAQNYAMMGSTEVVDVAGVKALKISLHYNAEMVGLVFLENRGSNIVGLVCMRQSLAEIAADQRTQCQNKLVSGRSNQGTGRNG